MQKETYERIFERVYAKKHGVTVLYLSGKALTYITACCYLAAVVGCCLEKGWQSAIVLLMVPAVSFLAVSIFRKCWNAERPYEIYDFTPLIAKDTRGKSFPSRHVFSIFVIGSTLMGAYPVLGISICLMGCVLAVIRVVAGVHFPKDVAAGGMIGVLCGCIAWYFL